MNTKRIPGVGTFHSHSKTGYLVMSRQCTLETGNVSDTCSPDEVKAWKEVLDLARELGEKHSLDAVQIDARARPTKTIPSTWVASVLEL